MRLDPPAVMIELTHDATSPRCQDRFAAGIVSLGGTVSRNAADQFDEMFQSQMQIHDFTYRVDTRRWVWGIDCDAHGIEDRIESINDTVAARIPGIRTKWSAPQMIPVDARRTHARISDLLVRESLSASSVSYGLDTNDVRPGTAPIEPSDVAAERLEQELRRLARQLKKQTSRLQQQAENLRPKT